MYSHETFPLYYQMEVMETVRTTDPRNGTKRSFTEEIEEDVDVEEARPKKKKQKLISTGIPKSVTVSQNHLYCVCKMPYDHTK